jgi:hypothetical protein
MADEGNVETFEYTVKGRLCTFRQMSKSRIIMLKRYLESLQLKSAAATQAEDVDALMELASKMNEATWTTIESQFINPEDLEWVQLEIIAGRLDEEDLLPLLSNGYKREEVADDADPAPAKRPGRKAPAKKAAKVAKATTPRAKR